MIADASIDDVFDDTDHEVDVTSEDVSSSGDAASGDVRDGVDLDARDGLQGGCTCRAGAVRVRCAPLAGVMVALGGIVLRRRRRRI
jgi:hypothetical protein